MRSGRTKGLGAAEQEGGKWENRRTGNRRLLGWEVREQKDWEQQNRRVGSGRTEGWEIGDH